MTSNSLLGPEATRARLEEFRAALLRHRNGGASEILAFRGSAPRRKRMEAWLQQAFPERILLRPPEPWDPLLPLRQLLQSQGLPQPQFVPEELNLFSLWLGPKVAWSRLFFRSALALSHHPVLAGIRATDLDFPIWGDLLNAVRQSKIAMPVAFLFEAESDHRILPGIFRLDLDTLEESALADFTASAPDLPKPTRLTKRTLAYLAQARFFGDQLQPQALRKVSRAHPQPHLEALRKAGLLDSSDQLEAQALARLELPPLPTGGRWHQRAFRLLRSRGEAATSKAVWLQSRLPSQEPQPVLDTATAARATIELGPQAARQALQSLPPGKLSPEAAAISVLQGIDLGEPLDPQKAPELQNSLLRLQMPFGPLLLGRLALRLGQKDAGKQLESCRDKLLRAQQPEAAALLSLELANWHLSSFRIRPALKCIGAVPQTGPWPILWLKNLAMAEAYIRMERHDFARSHLQKAVALPPRPMSPVLKGDLYLTMGHLFSRSGFDGQAEHILDQARDLFIGVRDGVRMGRYLIVRGEVYWRADDLDMAKQTFSRAVRILTELEAGLINREAELKLTLAMRGVLASTIETGAEAKPQDLELRQRFPEGPPSKEKLARDAEDD